MVGLGETQDEMIQVFQDLLDVGCKFLIVPLDNILHLVVIFRKNY